MGNERVTSVLKLLIIDEDEGYLRLREEALRQPDLHTLKASNPQDRLRIRSVGCDCFGF